MSRLPYTAKSTLTKRWSFRQCLDIQKQSAKGILVFLEISQNSQENTCARVSFLIKLQANFIKKEILAQVFSCEIREISNNTFSYRIPPVAASGYFRPFQD